MAPSRRQFLRLAGATAGAGALLGSASPVSAHGKPGMRWVSADSSNYTTGRSGHDIRWFVVHVTEGSYEGTVSWFQNPDANASTQYVIENDDQAEITQMVSEDHMAWHAGNSDYNRHSLGIEHEGYVDESTFTDALYDGSARIAQWAAETYGFPLQVHRYDMAPCNAESGAGGIIGHDQIPSSDCSYSGGDSAHSDPGSTWNWGRYEGYVRRFHVGAGESVVTASNLNVRDSPNGNWVDTAAQDTYGEIVDGPVSDGGYEWYQVEYADGTQTGWSAADWLLYARFNHWQGVSTAAGLSVRDAPNGSRIDTAYEGEPGTVVDGPVDAGGYRWWKVDYDSAQTGWSAGYWLR